MFAPVARQRRYRVERGMQSLKAGALAAEIASNGRQLIDFACWLALKALHDRQHSFRSLGHACGDHFDAGRHFFSSPQALR